jgi:ATP phosphoribosyltransferase
MLKIALPNKGSLSEEAVRLVSEAGYNCKRLGRELKISDSPNDIEFIFLRPKDIPVYVGRGVLDMGITGQDLVLDSEASVTEILKLGFGKAKFCYAVPEHSQLTPDSFNGKRIATSYPVIVREDLKRKGIESEIVKLDGAIEISINLGVADAVADVVQTGRTLVEAGLRITGEPVLESQAVLVGNSDSRGNNDEKTKFVKRLTGIVVARNYVMVEYDIDAENLEKACEITPGIEAPTVSPLNKKGWYAVKAMTRKKMINSIMDDLSDAGARGILVSDIRTCRI